MRLAAWTLVALAVVTGAPGLVFAFRAFGWRGADETALVYAMDDAMLATVLLAVAGSALVGLVVLRGVAELLNQQASAR